MSKFTFTSDKRLFFNELLGWLLVVIIIALTVFYIYESGHRAGYIDCQEEVLEQFREVIK